MRTPLFGTLLAVAILLPITNAWGGWWLLYSDEHAVALPTSTATTEEEIRRRLTPAEETPPPTPSAPVVKDRPSAQPPDLTKSPLARTKALR